MQHTENSPVSEEPGEFDLHPETLMLGYGYDPRLSEGAVKQPVFLTSTFVFETAEEGRDFFDFTSGRRIAGPGVKAGLVYSRFNHPNSEILEGRLAVYEGAEESVVLSSGMAAIATLLLAFVRPGDVVLYSQPVYGGTQTLLEKTLLQYGIKAVGFTDGADREVIRSAAVKAFDLGPVPIVFVETPSNPTNTMVDLRLVQEVVAEVSAQRDASRPLMVADNTMLGPIFQKPLRFGVDLCVYSLTKYVGGHSDLIAGAVVGSHELCDRVRSLRSSMGSQLDPHTCWMLSRSLETLSLRMRASNAGALKVAEFLSGHPTVSMMHHPLYFEVGSNARRVYEAQCEAPGSTFSFDVKGGRSVAYRVLNSLRVFKLAVSLGGTESLASHPASMTHSGIPAETRERLGITAGTIRLSIGVEHPSDLVRDLEQALAPFVGTAPPSM